MKVHQGSTTGAVLHTGQLFFEEDVNEMVEVLSPYSSHDVTRLTNDEDGIYNQGGYYGLISNWSLVGSDISEGIYAAITVEVDGATDGYSSYTSVSSASSDSSDSSDSSNSSNSSNSSDSSDANALFINVLALLLVTLLFI